MPALCLFVHNNMQNMGLVPDPTANLRIDTGVRRASCTSCGEICIKMVAPGLLPNSQLLQTTFLKV